MATTTNVFQTTVVIVLCTILFTNWNVGASNIDYSYNFPEQPSISLSSANVAVVNLDDVVVRVKRQNAPDSPDVATSSGDITPGAVSHAPMTDQATATNTTSLPPPSTGSSSKSSDKSNNVENSSATDVTTPGPNPFDEADVHFVKDLYYTYNVNNADLDLYWYELEDAKQHRTLSNGHRLAASIPLQFPFYFFGHEVKKVTVATGGFFYMSKFLHQWLTATQYVAPLMANFDPSLSKESNIYYQSTSDNFTVEWKDLILQDQRDAGKFHFQVVLNRDNTIHFLYKSVPIPISSISVTKHPVKLGLSDAWYNDTYLPEEGLTRRTIIEYHKIKVNASLIRTGSVVVLNPLPTCNRLPDCHSCTHHTNVSFNCKWCNTIGRCADGPDWYRQHWNRNGCEKNNHVDPSVCHSLPAVEKPIEDPHKPPTVKCRNGECDKKKSEFPVAGIVVIILLVTALLGGAGAWFFYAYTHPTSKSGMWLVEHRPSQIKTKIKFWKSNTANGTKYQLESDA